MLWVLDVVRSALLAVVFVFWIAVYVDLFCGCVGCFVIVDWFRGCLLYLVFLHIA